MSMYCVLCVNSLWCSQNMCDLAWLVSLNKTLLLNRMWGYIMGGARFASHKFYHPLPDHTGAVPTFLETRFFNFPGCRHDTAWAILVRNSASLPCLGWHKGWVHLWKFGGGGVERGQTYYNPTTATTAIVNHLLYDRNPNPKWQKTLPTPKHPKM